MSDRYIPLATDYLVVGAGAGAMGMAFVDELVDSSENIEVILLDTRAAPGGHWNYAYSFVKLHQPAITYGVNSRALGDGGPDLVSKWQILEHYELALQDLIKTGRVKFYPQCEYIGNARFVSNLDKDLQYDVQVLKKIVDATR